MCKTTIRKKTSSPRWQACVTLDSLPTPMCKTTIHQKYAHVCFGMRASHWIVFQHQCAKQLYKNKLSSLLWHASVRSGSLPTAGQNHVQDNLCKPAQALWQRSRVQVGYPLEQIVLQRRC